MDYGSMTEKQKEKLLNNDAGLKLVNDLVGSDKKFYYESAEAREISGDSPGTWFAAKDNNGVLNASNGGKDSEKMNFYKSAKGFDGEVIISSKGSWQETDSRGFATEITKPRGSIIFHELVENYERTHNGIDYNGSKKFPFGAHSLAVKREKTWWNKSMNPGGYNGYKNPDSKVPYKELYELYFPDKYNTKKKSE